MKIRNKTIPCTHSIPLQFMNPNMFICQSAFSLTLSSHEYSATRNLNSWVKKTQTIKSIYYSL